MADQETNTLWNSPIATTTIASSPPAPGDLSPLTPDFDYEAANFSPWAAESTTPFSRFSFYPAACLEESAASIPVAGTPNWPAASIDTSLPSNMSYVGVQPCLREEAVSPTFSWSQPSSPSSPSDLPMMELKTSPAGASKPASSTRTRRASKLRTAPRNPRKSTAAKAAPKSPTDVAVAASSDDRGSSAELRARRSHNVVEKQYRNRLNAQFERLLCALPPNQRPGRMLQNGTPAGGDQGRCRKRSSSDEGDGELAEEKRLSKAEVLDLATRRIKELEVERRRLLWERKGLLQDLDVMNGAVADAYGNGRGLQVQ